MDDRDGYRGWDLWIEKGRIGTHIIHKWPDEAIKVVDITALKPGEWNHVLLTYDGTGSDKGVALYLNGKRQTAARTQMNSLRGTIRTEVPLKVGQRHTASRLDGALVHGVRVYGRVALAPRGRADRRVRPRLAGGREARGPADQGRSRARFTRGGCRPWTDRAGRSWQG